MRALAAYLGIMAAMVGAPGTSLAGQTIGQIQGGVSAENVDRFAAFVGDHLDKIIGLKVSVDAGDNGGMNAHVTDGMFVVYKSGGDFEIVANNWFMSIG